MLKNIFKKINVIYAVTHRDESVNTTDELGRCPAGSVLLKNTGFGYRTKKRNQPLTNQRQNGRRQRQRLMDK